MTLTRRQRRPKPSLRQYLKAFSGLVKTVDEGIALVEKMRLQQLWKRAVRFIAKLRPVERAETLVTEDAAVTTLAISTSQTEIVMVPTVISEEELGTSGQLAGYKKTLPTCKFSGSTINQLRGTAGKIILIVGIIKCNMFRGFDLCGILNTWCTEVMAVDENGVEIPASQLSEKAKIQIIPEDFQAVSNLSINDLASPY